MATWKRFEDIDAWKEGCRLVCEVYDATKRKPWSGDLELRSQVRAAAISIPSNIAEGFERDSDRAFANALSIAKGSSGELRTQIYIAGKLGYVGRSEMRALVKAAEGVSRRIAKIILYLKRSASYGRARR